VKSGLRQQADETNRAINSSARLVKALERTTPIMIQIFRGMLGIFILSTLTLPMAQAQSIKRSNQTARVSQVSRQQHAHTDPLIEEFSFLIKDLKIDHQSEINNLNISVSYRYVVNITNSEYPDFRLLAKDIESLLINYPNETDYWEIVNKQLTSLLLKKYPPLMSITCELKVDPSRLDPYIRSSRVTRERPSARSNQKRV